MVFIDEADHYPLGQNLSTFMMRKTMELAAVMLVCTMVLLMINDYPLEGTTHHPNPLAVHGLESNEAMFYILSEVDLRAQTM